MGLANTIQAKTNSQSNDHLNYTKTNDNEGNTTGNHRKRSRDTLLCSISSNRLDREMANAKKAKARQIEMFR